MLRINNKSGVLTCFKTLINDSRCFCSSLPKGSVNDHSSSETESDYSLGRGRIDISKWETFDAKKLGINSSMISKPSQLVLKLLKEKGFKSYFVGGCVRDLILNRIPKDFDVVTTAKLIEARKQFGRHSVRAVVVGRRFPVCLVHIRGSVVEVTSFETEAKTSKAVEKVLHSLLPKCKNKEDRFLCKSSLRRDFTINSLFYDPFANKIYDYANGMADLRSLKLETVIPAQLSFKDDPGRILRGFRIAARLGLSLSRETEAAIWTCSSLVKTMNKDRVMIELNYMLSYGAAEPSLRLLWKFKLLQFLLPRHAAYLDKQATKEDALASNMLMQLFKHLDNLVGCDRPCDCTLWIGLLAFHLASLKNSQDALVVWALASVLYHGEWEGGIKFAKERAKMCVNFAPEIKRSSICKSDEEIAKAVTKLASLAIDSLHEQAFIPRKTGKAVSEIFEVLLNDITLYKSVRQSEKINYDMLGRGHISETRYVLGKIVLETMHSGIVGDGDGFEAEKCHLKTEGTKDFDQLEGTKDKRKVLSTPNVEHKQEKLKKQKLTKNACIAEQKLGSDELLKYRETNEEHQKILTKDFEAEKCHLKTEGTKDFDQLEGTKDKRKVLSTPNVEHKQEKLKKQKLTKNACIAEQKLGSDELLKYRETNEEHQKILTKDFEAEKCHLKTEGTKDFDQLVATKDKRKVLSTPNVEHKQEKLKKQKLTENACIAEQKMGSDELLKYRETNEEHQKPVKLHRKVDLSMKKNSMADNKSRHRKQLINDRKKIAGASKSSTDHARHLTKDEHCMPSKSTKAQNQQVVANNHNIKETSEENQKPVNLRQKVDLSMKKKSMPNNKSSDRKQLINDRNKIATASKSSTDHARHLNMDEHRTSSQSTVSKNHQVMANNHSIHVDVKTDELADKVVNKKGRQHSQERKKSVPSLSSLFK